MKRLAFLLLALLPMPAMAEQDSLAGLALVLFVLPGLVILLVLVLWVRAKVPRPYKPAAYALCFLPFSPIYNGVFPWPLYVYFIVPQGPLPTGGLVSVAVTLAVVYTATFFIGRRRP